MRAKLSTKNVNEENNIILKCKPARMQWNFCEEQLITFISASVHYMVFRKYDLNKLYSNTGNYSFIKFMDSVHRSRMNELRLNLSICPFFSASRMHNMILLVCNSFFNEVPKKLSAAKL